MLRETLIAMWHRRCPKIILDKTSFRIPVLSALAFRAVGVEYPSSMEARFRVRGRNYLSVRFIFRISDVKGQLDGFSWLVKNRLTSVQLKTLNSLVFFASTELLSWGSEAFYKCSNNFFAWSEILENGSLFGGVRRKWSMAALMDFAIRAIFLPRRRVKKLQTKFSSSFDISYIGFEIWWHQD